MRIYFKTLIILAALAMPLVLAGCNGRPQPKEKPAGQKPSAAEEDKYEPSAGTPEVSQLPPDYVDPKDVYEGDPEKDVADMALDIARKLFGKEGSDMYIIMQYERFRSPEIWIWECELEGDHGPAGVSSVRLDLGHVETFDVYQEYPTRAVRPGEELPNIITDIFKIDELGFVYDSWRSQPGYAVYRKHADISGNDVAIASFIVRYNPEDGNLIGVEWRGYDPVDSFEMNTDRQAAAKLAAEYLGDPILQPDHGELMQVQDGASRLKDLNIYWEFHFDKGWIYVRCKDGNVFFSSTAPHQPLSF